MNLENRNKWLLVVVCALTVSFSVADPLPELNKLARNRDYFQLAKIFTAHEKNLQAHDRLFFKALVEMTRNNSSASNKMIAAVIKRKFIARLSDSVAASLMTMKSFNHFKLYEYQDAADAGAILLEKYGSVIPAAQLKNYQNLQKIYTILKDAPRQVIHRRDSATLIVSRDKANLLNIPVVVDGEKHDFIFDTGANLSTISDTYAARLKLNVYEPLIDVAAFGGNVRARLGICPTLTIGQLDISNVVFLVLPDSALTFKAFDYKINAILGFPVMNAIGEVQFRKNSSLHLPKTLTESEIQNMAMEGLQPLIELEFHGSKLAFNFDTGAKRTDIFKRFDLEGFAGNLKLTDSKAKIGGAGGVAEVPVRVAEEVTFTTGGKDFKLKNVPIHTTRVLANDYSFGNIGQDFIWQYGSFTVNFKSMFIVFH